MLVVATGSEDDRASAAGCRALREDRSRCPGPWSRSERSSVVLFMSTALVHPPCRAKGAPERTLARGDAGVIPTQRQNATPPGAGRLGGCAHGSRPASLRCGAANAVASGLGPDGGRDVAAHLCERAAVRRREPVVLVPCTASRATVRPQRGSPSAPSRPGHPVSTPAA